MSSRVASDPCVRYAERTGGGAKQAPYEIGHEEGIEKQCADSRKLIAENRLACRHK